MEEVRYRSDRKMAVFMIGIVVLIGSIFAGMLHFVTMQEQNDVSKEEQVIALNEIEKLTEIDGRSPADEQIHRLQAEISEQKMYHENGWKHILVIVFVCVLVLVAAVFLSVWYRVIRPFHKLERYAGEIAKGNLDVSLSYERSNMFGAFTWAFDHMRREIQKARSCEREAIENNKTVIATLSHDIKTPIASIRAYAEGLEANMDTKPERKQRYLAVIMKKCDEVTALTNDLFLHSLSDLEKLQVTSEKENMKELLEELLEELNGERGDLVYKGTFHEGMVLCDRKRVAQVVANVINNARKYADNPGITVYTNITDSKDGTKQYEIHIKDAGCGILPEDMPFIFEKFYRGKNVSDAPGAGLGLYIVKYLMEQMDGEVRLHNEEDGLEVELVFLVS